MPENLNELIRRIINPLIFGNVIISLCAVTFLLETYILLGMPVYMDGLAFLVFFATLFLYNVHRLLSVSRIPPQDYGTITAWAAKHRFTLFMFSIIGAGGVAFFVFQTSLVIFGILIALGIISSLYELPLVRSTSRFRSLRNLWIHKAFMITTVWTLATAFLPAVNVEWPLFDYNLWLVLAERMLFIFMVALCFDARDIEFDRKEGLKTIPIRYGPAAIEKLYMVISGLLILVSGIHYFVLAHYYGTGVAMIVSTCITYLVISRTRTKQSDFYYLFLVDGMMILQFLLVLLLDRIW
ncbi:MAG: UbiA family prenyltransferase [Chitinophagales bacterium]